MQFVNVICDLLGDGIMLLVIIESGVFYFECIDDMVEFQQIDDNLDVLEDEFCLICYCLCIVVEELEMVNEELKSLNEEMMLMNEEF